MKIAIIGGGWVGCHLALKLKKEHEVVLYEKNNTLFSETSFYNQNRLHLGFHYARNSKTRILCQETFDKFISEYGKMTKKITTNLYCIPEKNSLIDFETYLKIFENFEFKKEDNFFSYVEGCISTKERYIDFKKIHSFFNENLSEIFVEKKISKKELKLLEKKYDLIINATNNHIKQENNEESFFELTVSLLYKQKNSTSFGALTFVDGDLFSIFPYDEKIFTVTDVKHTPLKKFKTLNSLVKYKSNISESYIQKKIKLIQDKIIKYYPQFLSDFEYSGFFISTKSKIKNVSDNRHPIIVKKNKTVSVFTGKIQGIYIIENYIQNHIKNEINNR